MPSVRRVASFLPRHALVSIIAVVIGAALIAAAPPLYGVLLIGALTALLLATWGARSLAFWIPLLLVCKPLIDLAWRWRFLEFAEQGVNVQAVVALFAILMTLLAIGFGLKHLVWSKTVILFAAFALFAVLLTPTAEGINELVRLWAGVSFFFTAGYVLRTEARFSRFARSFLIVTAIPIGLSFLQYAGMLPYEYWDFIGGQVVGRVTGTYQQPLGLIYFLIYAVPLALYLLAKPSQRLRDRLFLWSFVGASLMALMLTTHRTAIIAVSLEILIWLVLTRQYKLALMLIGLGGLLIVWQGAKLQTLYSGVTDIFQGNVGVFSDEFLRGRGSNWYLFLNSLLSSHPVFWLFGRGGSTAQGYALGIGYGISDEPHNDFIRLLHAYGFVGLGLYVTILGSFLIKSLRLRRAHDHALRNQGNLMIVALVAIAVLSITTEPMRYPSASWYLFALGSVITVRYDQWRNQIAGKQPPST